MFKDIKSIIKVACIYTATVIGAGFASGQEIIQFFSVYYQGGFYGIVVAGILFSLMGFFVLDRVYTARIKGYEEFILPLFGRVFGTIVEYAAAFFMFCLFCVMIAGSGRILSEKLGIPLIFAAALMSMLCLVFLLTSIKGLVVLSTFITPVIVAGIIFIGFYIIIFKDASAFFTFDYMKRFTDNWLFSSLIYVGYNGIMSVMVMSSLLPVLKSKRTGRMGGIFGGMILCFIALVLNTAISLTYTTAFGKELPVLDVLDNLSSNMGNVYALILWLAMLLSAVNAGFCLTERIRQKLQIKQHVLVILVSTTAVPLAMLGFSKLIASIYPVFGYIGLFLVFTILISGISSFLPVKMGFQRRK